MAHRWRPFTLSNDPACLETLTDIVGLSVAPPAHAVVLSIDDRSHSQARDRTQPGLPLKKGRGATMTHDYKRNGTPVGIATRSSRDASTASRARYPPASRSMPSSTTTPLTSTRTSRSGSHAILAGPSTSPHLERVAERARRRLRQADTTPSQIQRLPLRARTPARHPPRHRRTQHHRSQALRLDRRSRYHHRRKKKRGPNVGINLLGTSCKMPAPRVR